MPCFILQRSNKRVQGNEFLNCSILGHLERDRTCQRVTPTKYKNFQVTDIEHISTVAGRKMFEIKLKATLIILQTIVS